MGGYRECFQHAEDYDLWLRIGQRYSLYNIPKALTKYRISHSGVGIRNLWQPRLEALAAKVSLENPETPINTIVATLAAQQSERQKIDFLRQSYISTLAVADLQSVHESLRLLLLCARDLGWPYALKWGVRQSLKMLSGRLRGSPARLAN